MEALVDKIHKQGEHILQHCYISHNNVLTLVAYATLVGIIFSAIYLGMDVGM